MAAPTRLSCCFGSEPLSFVAQPQCGGISRPLPQCRGASWVTILLRLVCRPGWLWEISQPPCSLLSLCPVSGSSELVHASHKQASHSPAVSPTSPGASKVGSSSQCQTPRLGALCVIWTALSPRRVSTCVISFPLSLPPRGTAPDLIPCLPFLPDSVWIFLQILSCRNISSSSDYFSGLFHM